MDQAGLQDVLVAMVALGAAVIVVRRVIGFASAETSPKCANCESAACAPVEARPPRAASTASAAHPLVFVRPSQR